MRALTCMNWNVSHEILLLHKRTYPHQIDIPLESVRSDAAHIRIVENSQIRGIIVQTIWSRWSAITRCHYIRCIKHKFTLPIIKQFTVITIQFICTCPNKIKKIDFRYTKFSYFNSLHGSLSRSTILIGKHISCTLF